MEDVFEVRTYCKICHTNCGILVKRDQEGSVLAVRGDPDNPRSKGYICPKGLQTVQAHNRPDRLDYPLLNGERVSWDTLLDDLADKVRVAVATHGPNAFGIYGAMGCDDLGWDTLQRLYGLIGSTSFYTAGTVDVAPDWKAAELVTGHCFGVEPHMDLEDEDVRLALFVGTNPLVSHNNGFTDAGRSLRAFKGRGGKVWVVDPVRTRTAMLADRHLRPLPGTDPLIMAWLVREVLEALPAGSPVREKTKPADLERLRDGLKPFDRDTVCRIAGVEASLLEELLADIRSIGRLNMGTGTGSRFGPHSLVSEWLRWALLIVTDSIEEPGGMWVSPGWQNPVEKRPGWVAAPESGEDAPVASRPDLQRIAGQIPVIAIPDEIEHGPLRILINNGGNPITAFPEPERMARVLKSLDAFVTIDVVTTAATELSTHVLTSTGRLERIEYNPIQSGRPQFTPMVVEPTAERWHAWYIIGQLAKRLGYGDQIFNGLDPDTVTADDLYRAKLANARNSYDELKEQGALGLSYERSRVKWALETAVPEGKWRVAPKVLVDRLPELLKIGPTAEFPLMMMSGRQERRMNTNDNVVNRKKGDKGAIFISQADAERFGVTNGGYGVVRSENGQVTAEIVVDDRMREGTLTVPHGWVKANVNNLTSLYGADKLHGQPQMTAIPVMLEPTAAPVSQDEVELEPAE